jgi:hypothetical protein
VKNKLILKDLSLAGIFMGLIVVLNLVSALLPVIMGYSINFYTIFLGLILIILKTNLIRNLFFAITPLILLFDPNVY